MCLPEFFATAIRAERLPGGCVRFVYSHPIEGEIASVIVPYACWLAWRLELSRFALECAAEAGTSEPRELMALAH